jgi:anthraniloyl-CoA monooxygenase
LPPAKDIRQKHLDGHALMSNAKHLRGSAWIQFPRVLCEKLEPRKCCADGRCGGQRAISRSGRAPSWRWKAPSRWRNTCIPSRHGGGLRALSGRAAAGGAAAAVGRAQLAGMVRGVERYFDLDPVQFNYSLLTRSQRISHENLRLRDPEWLEQAERWFQTRRRRPEAPVQAPMFAPFKLRDMEPAEPRRRLADGPVQGRRTAARPIGTWSTMASAPRAAPGWSIPR